VKSTVSTSKKWSIWTLIREASLYNSVLDIGCGTGRAIKRIKSKTRIGLDVCQAAIDVANENNNGVEFKCANLVDLKKFCSPNSIECIIGVDIIEHFFKLDALQLISECEEIATKCLIFFVPVGNHPQTKDDRGFGNDYFQTHRSTWYPVDMEELGYTVFHYPEWHPKKVEKGAMFCLKHME